MILSWIVAELRVTLGVPKKVWKETYMKMSAVITSKQLKQDSGMVTWKFPSIILYKARTSVASFFVSPQCSPPMLRYRACAKITAYHWIAPPIS